MDSGYAEGNYWSNSQSVSRSGFYKLESRENENDLLRVQGFPWLTRKIMGWMKPTLEVEQNGDNWKLVYNFKFLGSTNPFEIKFRLGEMFDLNPRAGNMKGVASFVNNRLTVKPLNESDSLFSSITVEFTDSGLIETTVAKHVTASRLYRRI